MTEKPPAKPEQPNIEEQLTAEELIQAMEREEIVGFFDQAISLLRDIFSIVDKTKIRV